MVSVSPGGKANAFCVPTHVPHWVTALVEVTRRQESFVPDLLISRLEAINRDDALREMSRLISQELSWTMDQQNGFVDALLHREDLGSTGIGNGFAVPHAKVDWVDQCFTVMALAPDGIAFNSIDRKLVHTIIMIVAPQSRPGEVLRLLERISRFTRWVGRSES